jgi:hypothetical protein
MAMRPYMELAGGAAVAGYLILGFSFSFSFRDWRLSRKLKRKWGIQHEALEDYTICSAGSFADPAGNLRSAHRAGDVASDPGAGNGRDGLRGGRRF